MKSFIHRTALSNAVTLAIAALSGRGGDVLDPSAPRYTLRIHAVGAARTVLSAKRIDWLQVVLLAIAFLSIVALFFIDIYG